MINMIACMGKNRAIGKNNQMPWKLPADLKHFKKITTPFTVVMGRKTYESIGKPLPDRINVILTTDKNYQAEGCTVYHDIPTLIENEFVEEGNTIFVIGGAEIYKQFLPYANKLYVTIIEEEFEADAYFPEINLKEWEQISFEKGIKDEKNKYDYNFYEYKRKEN